MHRRAHGRVLALLAALIVPVLPAVPAPAAAGPVAPGLPVVPALVEEGFRATLTEAVAPGVSRRLGTLATTTGTQVVQLIDVDPSTPGIRLESLRPANGVRSLDTVRNQAAAVSRDGHRVVAAVNGDVWLTDGASGTQVADGTPGPRGRAADRLAPRRIPRWGSAPDGAVRIGDASLAASVTLPDDATRLADRPGEQVAAGRAAGAVLATLGRPHGSDGRRPGGRPRRRPPPAPADGHLDRDGRLEDHGGRRRDPRGEARPVGGAGAGRGPGGAPDRRRGDDLDRGHARLGGRPRGRSAGANGWSATARRSSQPASPIDRREPPPDGDRATRRRVAGRGGGRRPRVRLQHRGHRWRARVAPPVRRAPSRG